MERISQIVLIVVGLLALVVLTLGLVVSCRQPPPDAAATLAPGTLPLSTIPPTWTPLFGADLTATAAAPIPAGQTATPTPFGATPGDGAPSTPGGSTVTPGDGAPPAEAATALPTAAPAPPASPPASYAPGATVRHSVNRGEWLLQIARCYGAPYAAVHAANALPNPDYILPGQVIIVPNIGSAGRIIGPPCVQAYFVQAGDTWESLATRFGTTTAILQRANPGNLAPGRAIWAPRN